MALSCPVKSSPEWKALVDKTGSEIGAYKAFINNGYDIPDVRSVTDLFENDIIEYNLLRYKVNFSDIRGLSGDRILAAQEDNVVYSPEDGVYEEQYYDLSPISSNKQEDKAEEILLEPIFNIPLSKLIEDGFTVIERSSDKIEQDDLMFAKDNTGKVILIETANEAIDYLKEIGVVNKIKFQEKWLVRRTEGKYLDKYFRNIQGENLVKIRAINKHIREDHATNEDLYLLKEYGESYEVTVNERLLNSVNEKRKGNILLNVAGSQKASKELDQKIKAFLRAIGVDIKSVEDIKTTDGKIMDVTAKADMLRKVIEVVNGSSTMETLPEEASHFFVAMLGKNHPLYKSMMDRVEDMPEYAEVLEGYKDYDDYKNEDGSVNYEKIREEAVGKIITKEIVAYHESGEQLNRQEKFKKNWFARLWDYIKSIFGKVDASKALEYFTPYQEAAKAILEIDTGYLSAPTEGVFFQKLPVGTPLEKQLATFHEHQNTFERRLTKNENLPRGVQHDPSGETLRYYDKATGKMLPYSVSDIVHKTFRRYKGHALVKRMNESEDSRIRREAGTMLHAVMENIAMKLIQSDESGLIDAKNLFEGRGLDKITMTDKQLAEMSMSEAGIDKYQYSALKNYLMNMIEEIKEHQREINKETGKDGKVTLLPEQFIVNGRQNTGGTIDLLAVFSDTTKAVYDYKFISPSARYTVNDPLSWDKVLVSNPITAGKYTAFDQQVSGYKKILMEDYATVDPTATAKQEDGKSMFWATRAAIFQVHFAMKPKNQRREGSNITNQIVQLTTNSELLGQLPLARELSSSTEMNKRLIKPLQDRIVTLETKMKGSRSDKYKEYVSQINTLRGILESLLLRNNSDDLFIHINSILNKLLGKGGVSGGLSVEDKNSPEYISNEALLNYHDMLKIYRNLRLILKDNLEDLRISENKKDNRDHDILSKRINNYQGNISSAIDDVENKIDQRNMEIMDEADIEDKSFKSIGFIERFGKRLSQLDHPSFQAFSRKINLQQNEKRIRLREVEADVTEKLMAVEQWARANSMSTQAAVNLLINKDTANMYGRFSTEFWESRNAALKDGDIAWMKKHYEPREGWEEIYNIKYNDEKKRLQYDFAPVEGVLTEAGSVSKINKELTLWERRHNVKKYDSAWLHYDGQRYLTFKEEVFNDKNLSKEYKFISKSGNKALLDFYEMIEAYTNESRDLLGVGKNEIPSNFLPWIRKDWLDRITSNGLMSFLRESVDSLKIREYDDVIGIPNADTGLSVPTVPMFFTNPIMKADGTVDYDAKSKDLARSIYHFMEMALEFEAMVNMESDINILLRAVEMNNNGELVKNDRGVARSTVDGTPIKKIGIVPNTVELLEAFRDFYLYGIHMRNKGWSSASGFNSTKVILAVKSYMSLKILGFGLIPAGAAWLAGRIALSAEASKGLYITKEDVRKSMLMLTGRRSIAEYKAIGLLFDPYQETRYHRIANKLSTKKRRRNINWLSDLFMPYRAIDANLDDLTSNSTVRRWGIGKDGLVDRIDRLRNEDPDAKTIKEMIQFDAKTGAITIEGVVDKGKVTNIKTFTSIRTLIKNIGSGIKGNMSREDVKYSDMILAGVLAFQFKNWMPGFYLERLGKMKYNKLYDIADQGRYIAYASNFSAAEKQSFVNYMNSVLLPNLGKTMLDLANFGLFYKFKVNEDKMRYLHNKYLTDHSLDPSELTFEAYMEIKQAQSKAMMSELRYMLAIVSLILALGGDWDDDGKKNYAEYWATRKLFALINRTETEIMAAYNPRELIRLLANPFPVSRLGIDLMYAFGNTFDEFRDFMFGENSPYDKTPIGYYSVQFVPGLSHLNRLIETFEQNKQYKAR